jgi:hypothetical protein
VILDFNEYGLINPGIHEMDMDDFHISFVKQFTTSQRRQLIFDSLLRFVAKMFKDFNIYEIWIDGSYVTEKINPNDVDIVIFFSVEDFIRVSKIWDVIRKDAVNIDPYCAVAVTEENKQKLSSADINTIINKRNYWKGQFGFDREDRPKGIINIKADNIVEYIKGGESGVV